MFIFALLEFFRFLDFIIYGLFLFAISLLVRQVTMLSPQKMSSLCRVTTYDIVPFHLGIVIQEIEIVQKAFVTELL